MENPPEWNINFGAQGRSKLQASKKQSLKAILSLSSCQSTKQSSVLLILASQICTYNPVPLRRCLRQLGFLCLVIYQKLKGLFRQLLAHKQSNYRKCPHIRKTFE